MHFLVFFSSIAVLCSSVQAAGDFRFDDPENDNRCVDMSRLRVQGDDGVNPWVGSAYTDGAPARTRVASLANPNLYSLSSTAPLADNISSITAQVDAIQSRKALAITALKDARDEIALKDVEISNLEQRIQTLEHQKSVLENKLQEEKKANGKLLEKIAEQKKIIIDLRNTVSEQIKTIDDLRNTVSEQIKTIDDLNKETDKLQKELKSEKETSEKVSIRTESAKQNTKILEDRIVELSHGMDALSSENDRLRTDLTTKLEKLSQERTANVKTQIDGLRELMREQKASMKLLEEEKSRNSNLTGDVKGLINYFYGLLEIDVNTGTDLEIEARIKDCMANTQLAIRSKNVTIYKQKAMLFAKELEDRLVPRAGYRSITFQEDSMFSSTPMLKITENGNKKKASSAHTDEHDDNYDRTPQADAQRHKKTPPKRQQEEVDDDD